MSAAAIAKGCIYHWRNFTFSDGTKANKYFVILGANKGKNVLAVIATSKAKKRKFEPGCDAKGGYYHIPGGGKDWFPMDTWLLLAEVVELIGEDFADQVTKKVITLEGTLRNDISNAICNCLRRCDDVSEDHIALL